MREVPVYLFTGFLESGKTVFIKNSIMDPQFNSGERTLLIICEDGEEQYDLDEKYLSDVNTVYIENEEDLNADYLEILDNDYQPERVMIEFNGMWSLNDLYMNLPENWPIAQQINIIDATTFDSYNTMFRNLMVEKIAGAEFILFNRVDKDQDKMPLHKAIRAVSRNGQIAYEYFDGTAEYDNIADPLPFDINADVIELAFEDYALWMRDVVEEPEKYHGKKIHLTAKAQPNIKLDNGFNFGRRVMTCCIEDIKFMGFICHNMTPITVKLPGWYEIEANIVYEYNKAYRKKMPALKAYKIKAVPQPENEVALFY